MSTARSLARYGGLNLLHGAVGTGSAAVAAGLLYRQLGADFGVLALITGGMLRLNPIDDSLGAYLVTAVARRRRPGAAAGEPPAATGEPGRETGARISSALALGAGSAAVFGAVFTAAAAALLRDRPDAVALAFLGGGGLALGTLAGLAARLLEGNEDYVLLRAVQSAVALLRLGAVVVLIRAAVASTAAYAALYVASFGLLFAVLAAAARLRLSGLRRSAPAAGERPFRSLAGFLRPLLIARGAAVVSYRLDLWIVQALAGTTATAAYAMAEAVAGLVAQALEVLKAVLPVSVSRWRGRDPEWVRRFVLGTSKAGVLLVGTAAVALWAAVEPVLEIWFGAAPAVAVIAARLLLAFYALTAFRSAVQVILTGQGRFGDLEGPFLRAAALNLAVSALATAAWGGWGAALGTLVAGIYLLIANSARAERALGIQPATLARRLYLPGIVCLALASAAGGAIGGGGAVWTAVVRGGAAAALFAALAWWLLLDPRERRWLAALPRRGAARGASG